MTLDERELRALLDEAAHIEDDGFTDRVMRTLPPAHPTTARRAGRVAAPSRWRYLSIGCASLLGCASAYAATGGGRPLAQASRQLVSGHVGAVALTVAGLLAMMAMIATATSSD
jgi:hypothetical protein